MNTQGTYSFPSTFGTAMLEWMKMCGILNRERNAGITCCLEMGIKSSVWVIWYREGRGKQGRTDIQIREVTGGDREIERTQFSAAQSHLSVKTVCSWCNREQRYIWMEVQHDTETSGSEFCRKAKVVQMHLSKTLTCWSQRRRNSNILRYMVWEHTQESWIFGQAYSSEIQYLELQDWICGYKDPSKRWNSDYTSWDKQVMPTMEKWQG